MTNDFQSRLRQSINNKGISASELSRLSGVGKSDISNYLNGKYEAKQDKVYMLARALDVDPGWLMTGVEQIPDPDRQIVIPDSELFGKILLGMDPIDYQIVMEILERTEIRLRKEGKL